MSPTDKILFERWRVERDVDAFTHLAEKYGAMVFAVGQRITGNAQDAEDVAQGAFEALASQSRPPKAHLGAWLHRVTTNGALKLLRGEGRRKDREARYGAAQPQATTIGWEDIYDLVDESIAALSEEQRDIVVTYYFLGKTHQEIAEELAISRPAVTQRLQKAVSALRGTLRRRGVTVPVTILSGLLVQGSQGATPAALTLKLTKIALSGYGGKAGAGIGLWQTGVVAFTGTKVLGALLLIALVASGYWAAFFWYPGQDDARDTEARPMVEVVPLTTEEIQARATASGKSRTSSGAASVRADAPIDDEDLPHEMLPDSIVIADRGYVPLAAQQRASVVGEVIDEQGRPYPGAMVSLTCSDENDASVPSTRRGITADEEGKFEIGGLWGGMASAVARRPGNYHPSPEELGEAIQFEVLPGVVHTGLRLVLDRRKEGTIEGRVVGDTGSPIAGARITSTDLESGGSFNVDIRSDADGRFVVPHLRSDGRYTINVDAEGWSFGVVENVPAGSKDVKAELVGQGSIEGRVVNAHTGKAVAQFVCVASRSSIGGSKSSSARAEDDRGNFHLDGVDAGDAHLRVSAPGYSDRASIVSGVEPRKVTKGVVIEMVPTCEIAGVVTDEQGKPIEGAEIWASNQNGGGRLQARTDGAGKFRLAEVAESITSILVTHDDFESLEVAVDPREPRELKIVLSGGGIIEGLVTVGGVPASRVKVYVTGEGNTATKHRNTRSDGTYQLSGINRGTVEVTFSDGTGKFPPTYRTRSVEAVVAAGSTTVVDMDYPAASSSIEGFVYRSGEPIERAQVRLQMEVAGASEHLSAWTDGSGYYHFPDLPAGTGSLAVAQPDGRMKRVFIELPADTTFNQDIFLEEGVSVLASFLNIPEGTTGIRVVAYAAGMSSSDLNRVWDEASAMAYSRNGEAVSLESLSPGTYTIVAWAENAAYRSASTGREERSVAESLPLAQGAVVVGEGVEASVVLSF